ncbi:hypothetical protein H2203_000246 [Taxawa tesnikishii (nom. ined.)]|nr:hypothetical protein H2203_000246 [Dothideales sp. JES 119]
MPPAQEPAKKPARKFAVEPVETSSKSSRNNHEQDASHNAPRKFAVEPVETTTKSSKDKAEENAPKKAPRKFAVQPVETSTKSSKKQEEQARKLGSRFAPQPIETTRSTNRRLSPPDKDEPLSPTSKAPEVTSNPPRRKFAPQLVDTSKRTRKNNDPGSTLRPSDKTDFTPGSEKRPLVHRDVSLLTAQEGSQRLPLPHERRRETSPFGLARSNSRHSNRSHSFRLPDLDTIESSESEPSNPPSLSTSPSSQHESPLTGSDVALSDMYKHATRIRESVDENFSRYLLEIEAKRAEQKLREQALAAFPNSDFHEPVHHYVDEESVASEDSDFEIDDRPATWEGHEDDDVVVQTHRRRRSTTKVNWELKELQEHHEQLEQDRLANGTTAKRHSTAPSPWWNPAAHDFAIPEQRDPELRKMRDRARPPMLGGDLRFPRTASPEPARFDVTQGSTMLRSQMCYLTEQSEANSLNPKSADGLWAKSSMHSARSTKSQGLWGGFCLDNGEDHAQTPGRLVPPSGPTGLLTPANEPADPFSMSFNIALSIRTPPTPQPGKDDVSRIDSILQEDRELDLLMEREFPDSFVTQVYNYLSLGYPSLARPFDEELSKISKIPIKDLRHDDEVARTMPRGYIRLGDDFEGRGDGMDQELTEGGGCVRWQALKRYIREWARQEKGMVTEEAVGGNMGGNWGTGARRGSWAW